jgi:phosphoglucosamine mutase
LVDKSGRLYNGDELLYLMVTDRLARDEVVAGVVGTLMTNMAVELALKNKNISFIRSKVGDRYVLEALQENSWLLGGEGSGHLLCLDHHSTGDGTIAALQVLAAVTQKKKTLAQLLDKVHIFPQVLLNVRYKSGYDWKSDQKLAQQIAKVESDLKGFGRVLIRASGTEPLVRVMVETEDAEIAMSAAKSIADLVPTS